MLFSGRVSFFGVTIEVPCLHTDKKIHLKSKSFSPFTPAHQYALSHWACARLWFFFGWTFIGMPNRKLFEIQTNTYMHEIQCHFHSIFLIGYWQKHASKCVSVCAQATVHLYLCPNKKRNVSSFAIQDERYSWRETEKNVNFLYRWESVPKNNFST